MIIENTAELLSHGNVDGRRIVLEILEAGLRAPDPYENTRKLVRVSNGKLIVGHPDFSQPPGQEPLEFKLSQAKNIYVVGGGKAVQREAKALEDALGDLITEGHIIAKKGDSIQLERIGVTLAAHPVPDEDGMEGARKIIEIEQKATEGDVVFWCNSGGGTSLQALPVPGITLEDLQEVYRVLYFGCGANMPAANAVRNQLTLLRSKHPRYVRGATLVQILTAETPPNLRVHTFQRPTHVDAYPRAIEVLKGYGCWERVPESVRAFLSKADPRYGPLTPEELRQRPLYHYRVMGPEYMLDAAKAKAEEMGLTATIVVSSLSDVEAQPVAETFAYMAQEVEALGRPISPPCVLICGGELVVAVGDEKGVGGRSQEFVLAAAPRIAESQNVVIASADSDGTDGPTNAAGGIVDGYTMGRAGGIGIDVFEELRRHNSNGALGKLGDTILTGVLGTNVQDLRIVYVGGDRG